MDMTKKRRAKKMMKKKSNDAGSRQKLSSLNPGVGEALAG